jgi:hypothetical protein
MKTDQPELSQEVQIEHLALIRYVIKETAAGRDSAHQ